MSLQFCVKNLMQILDFISKLFDYIHLRSESNLFPNLLELLQLAKQFIPQRDQFCRVTLAHVLTFNSTPYPPATRIVQAST